MLRPDPSNADDDDGRSTEQVIWCAKVIDQDRDGVSLARLSVHGTHLEKRLARGNPGINRLDRIAKAHDIDYGKVKDLKDK